MVSVGPVIEVSSEISIEVSPTVGVGSSEVAGRRLVAKVVGSGRTLVGKTSVVEGIGSSVSVAEGPSVSVDDGSSVEVTEGSASVEEGPSVSEEVGSTVSETSSSVDVDEGKTKLVGVDVMRTVVVVTPVPMTEIVSNSRSVIVMVVVPGKLLVTKLAVIPQQEQAERYADAPLHAEA